MNDWRAWLRNQSPWNLGALIAVTALAGWLLFVIPKLFFALLALFVLGVVMAKLSEPLGQDEAGVVSGWWDH
ncbi:hypothetical protein, partial [Frankia sp. CIT1]